MIKSIEFTNTLGDSLKINLTSPDSSYGLWVKSIKGLGPGKASINITDLASSDGGIYNSGRSETRNITMTIGVIEYEDSKGIIRSVEEARRNSYRWFGKKNQLMISVKTDRINLYTNGYVESCEPDIFNKQETMSISILCPDPNWYNQDGDQIIDFSSTEDKFEFPMEFKVSTDNPFISGKTYYEYDIDTQTYFITEDAERIGGKTYYEEETFHIEDTIYAFDDEGYSNESVDDEDEYTESEDESFLPGVEYYEYDSLNDIYFLTNDFTMQFEKTYYKYLNLTEFSEILEVVEKSVKYNGEIETGVIIDLSFYDSVTGLHIYKLDTGETMTIDDDLVAQATGSGGLSSGDSVTISTIDGNKYAYLLRNGTSYNILNSLGKNPDWFKLHKGGDNIFSYSATSGEDKISVKISYVLAYEGI